VSPEAVVGVHGDSSARAARDVVGVVEIPEGIEIPEVIEIVEVVIE